MKLVSVNLSTPQPLAPGDQAAADAPGRHPVEGAVKVGRMGLDVDPGPGVSRALFAYPHEHYPHWQTMRAQARVADWGDALPLGLPGEHLTLQGLTEERLWVGDYLVFPHCVLAVSEPHFPDDALNAAMGFRHAARMMWQSGFSGGWLGVIEPGTIAAGEAFTLRAGPRDVNLRDLFRARTS